MARKNRRMRYDSPPLPSDGASLGGTQSVEGPSWDWGSPYKMRRMGRAAAKKFYVCPGCNQNIPPGVEHVVAWPQGRENERRHWHRGCWDRR